jgi:orotate phosphoribosyltransferase
MSDTRAQLLALLARKSFRLGKFILSSGVETDYYIDCRTTTLDAVGARLTGETFLDEIRTRGWNVAAAGGLTLGADPIAVSMAVLSGGKVNAFLVRKAEKAHGTAQRIEGFRETGAPVVIVEDVCTTGASTIQALKAAQQIGFRVMGVICLVDREEADGRANVEREASPAPFVSIFTTRDLRDEYQKQQQGIALSGDRVIG